MNSIDFKAGDRIVDKTANTIFPMTVKNVNKSGWDIFFIQCEKDFDNEFIDKSRNILKDDAKLFCIQKPDYVIFIKYSFDEDFRIELPYFNNTPDIGMIWAFLEKFLSECYKRFSTLSENKSKVKTQLINILNDDKAAVDKMMSIIRRLYNFPTGYKNYYHIEYSQSEKLFYFDCFTQDGNTLFSVVLSVLISIIKNTGLSNSILRSAIDSI